MTLNKTARFVIESTAKSEGVPEERIRQAVAAMEGNANESPAPVRLLTQKEYAERWGCTVRSVQRWIKTGELQAIRRGRLVRIPVRGDEI